jgi:hypothetical protein
MKSKLLYLLAIILCCVLSVQAQSVTGITPSSGHRGQALTVTITGSGTHFITASPTLVALFSSATSTAITGTVTGASSNTSLTVLFSIPLNTLEGIWSLLTVNTDDGEMVLNNAFTILTAGVKEQTVNQPALSVYPNPTTDMLNIGKLEKVTEVSIYDVSGKMVHSIQEPARNPDGPLRISTGPLRLLPGTYVMTVRTSSGVRYCRFVKE